VDCPTSKLCWGEVGAADKPLVRAALNGVM
jgi:hypothetical protein